MEPVYILGGGRTDFKRNLKKEGKTLRNLIVEAGQAALKDAKIDPKEIQAAAVGNFNGGQVTKQLHLGAFVPEIDLGAGHVTIVPPQDFFAGETAAPEGDSP